jgi:hypothetical protein
MGLREYFHSIEIHPPKLVYNHLKATSTKKSVKTNYIFSELGAFSWLGSPTGTHPLLPLPNLGAIRASLTLFYYIATDPIEIGAVAMSIICRKIEVRNVGSLSAIATAQIVSAGGAI